jgi:pimeloyl-ACP methyl ester carboxylesterase
VVAVTDTAEHGRADGRRDVEDTRIHHLDAGLPDADVILLLHAFPLQPAMWDDQLRWSANGIW